MLQRLASLFTQHHKLSYVSARIGSQANNRGFTLAEMAITVMVMAILLGISTPAIYAFMRQRDRQNEEINLNEVRKAMQAYLADKGSLPSDTGTGVNAWYNQLAGYTNLSSNEIANDVWGRPHSYIVYLNNARMMFGTSVNIYYATVHSMGLNASAENTYLDSNGASITIPGLAIAAGSNNNNTFAGSTSTSWWKAIGSTPDAIVNAFSSLRPGGDDQMIRFTNYSETLDRYNTTVQRLDHLTQALETYARSGYASRVQACGGASPDPALCANGIPEQTIYYPRASPVYGGGDDATVKYSNSTVIVNNANNDTLRRDNMQALMNVLGLPAEFCCSALTNASDGKPMPFYYFSNPRARTDTNCQARPTGAQGKLPARITTINSSDGNSDRTCG